MNEDMKILQKICDLVITMIYDKRIPIEVREEYRKKVSEELTIIPLMSYDLMKQLSHKG